VSATLRGRWFDLLARALALLRFVGDPDHTRFVGSGTSRIAPRSSAWLAAFVAGARQMRLLARLGAPVLEPSFSLLRLQIFSVAVVTARDSLLLVFLPVLLSVSVSTLVLPAVSIAFAIAVAVPIVAIPVITSSCVSR
jgi:hypothetical protein